MKTPNELAIKNGKDAIANIVAKLKTDSGALFDSPDVIEYLSFTRTDCPGEYARWREIIKGTKTFPISQLDLLTNIKSGVDFTAVDELIDLANQSCVLFHDKNGDCYAELTIKDVEQIWHLRSEGFKKWLRSKYYETTERGVSDLLVSTAIETLGAIATNEGRLHMVHRRYAKFNDKYYIDLCDDKWRVVEVSLVGWKLLERSPVKFIRSSSSRSLLDPATGEGSIDLLWNHINMREEQRLLQLAWMLECLRPDTPFVVEVLLGEQGSAKSTAQKRLCDLIDPTEVALRGAPKTSEDIVIAARNNWLLSYENLSSLSPEQQDTLCMILTGGAIAKRQLYTNFEEASVEIKRPVVLNGIATVITRPDLLDRSIIFDLPTIPDENRKEQTACDQAWERDRGRIFSGLLDLFVLTMGKVPHVHLEKLPRMADFARLGEAMSRVLGFQDGRFLSLYLQSREAALDIVIEGDPVAMALDDFLDGQSPGFELTTKSLYDKLLLHRSSSRRDFPQSPRGLGNSLRRLAPIYRLLGWEIHQGKKEKGIVVTMKRIDRQNADSASADIQPEQLNVLNVSVQDSFEGKDIGIERSEH